ncbi:MAG: hypothetical protein UC328_10290, partial [Adlercreutzia sp.]|nr:hypothetical protein [Adlercreutzia sp.]
PFKGKNQQRRTNCASALNMTKRVVVNRKGLLLRCRWEIAMILTNRTFSKALVMYVKFEHVNKNMPVVGFWRWRCDEALKDGVWDKRLPGAESLN